MISPVDIVGNISADKNSAIGPFVNVASGENVASIVNSENIANIVNSANIANIVMDPFGNIGDRALGNISAVDPFLVQPDLPKWVGLMTMTPALCVLQSACIHVNNFKVGISLN